MPADKKDLAAALLASLAPHLTDVADDEQSLPKGILKTMRHLAEQVLRARAKQAKRVAKAAPRNARQQLTGELLTALQQQVGDEQLPVKKTAKLLTKTAEDLAGKVTKLRAKKVQAQPEEPAPAAKPRATRTAAPRTPPAAPRAKRSQPKPAADPDVTA